MIEDALKSTRTLHRLIMTVALVTIIFGLSISLPEDKLRQREIIDGLIAIEFTEYNTYIQTELDKAGSLLLSPIGSKLIKALEDSGHLTFGLDKIGSELSKPIHVGRILVNSSILSEVSNTSLTSLNALNGLSLNRDIQILVPRTDELVAAIGDFLSENSSAGKRIDTLRITIDDFDFNAESFLPGTETNVGIYFELLDVVRVGGAPTFSANFVSDIKTLPNTSFIYWLKLKGFDEKFLVVENKQVKFAPELENAPSGFTNEKLGVLSLKLANDIAKSGPANQSVSILGTNIPGSLVIFASPIILFFLTYYFLNHTSHLLRVSKVDPVQFEQFAWLPLSLNHVFRYSFTGNRRAPIFAGILEIIGSAIILPIAALILLYVQLSQFGGLSLLHRGCMLVSAVGIAVFGLFVVSNINQIKHFLENRDKQTKLSN